MSWGKLLISIKPSITIGLINHFFWFKGMNTSNTGISYYQLLNFYF